MIQLTPTPVHVDYSSHFDSSYSDGCGIKFETRVMGTQSFSIMKHEPAFNARMQGDL